MNTSSKGQWRVRDSYELGAQCVFIESDTNERIACVRNPADAELICRAVNEFSEVSRGSTRPARDLGFVLGK